MPACSQSFDAIPVPTSSDACFGATHTGARVYLEPWLYTRVGPRVAPFPYQQAAAVADPTATIGHGQRAAAATFVSSLLLGLIAIALRLRAAT